MRKQTAPISDSTAPDREARGFSFALEMNTARGGERLELRALHRESYGAICADWTGAEQTRRIAAGRRQPLSRAVGLHKHQSNDAPLRVLDATAGLGRDGFTLAALGAEITLAERNPQVRALLTDARRRALALSATREAAARIEVIETDARALFAGGGDARHWDVIYLDPMYPDTGAAALPSKEMQILRDLTGGDADADLLLTPALECAYLRVVVKRPSSAPWLSGEEPSMSLAGSQLRFDVYLKNATRSVKPVHDFHIP